MKQKANFQMVWRSVFATVALATLLGSGAALATELKIALNWKPEPEFGGFYAGLTDGAYKSRALEAQIQPGGSGTPVVQMIASGQIDFGIVSADEIAIAHARGADVVALFAVYQTNPQGIMVHAQKNYANLRDVFTAPGPLAIQQGLPYAQFLLKKFAPGGGQAPLKAKLVPYAGGISGFLYDPEFSQQCFVTSEPIEAKKKGASTKVFLVASEGYNPYTTVLTTRGDFARKHTELVQRVVAAVREGWNDYLMHPDATNKAMQALNPSLDLASFQAAAEAQKPLIETPAGTKLGSMTSARWEQLTQQLVDLKVIDHPIPASTLFLSQ